MCGIVGFIDPGGITPSPDAVLTAMADSLAHRGPDDQGAWRRGPAWLAHRRLSIVDPTEAGRQPFVASDANTPELRGDVVALANGEIYNHRALRGSIGARWPQASVPASDCGVLPWLWRLHEEGMPGRLRGMYGLAVWDDARQTLLLARDAAGQKPLYWAELPGGGLAFASEPKALLTHPGVPRRLDPVALRRYFTYDYVPGRATIYRDIRRLEAGTWLRWRGGEITEGAHFGVPTPEPFEGSQREAEVGLWTALGDAVEARLMSDVPLGVFLSGGLDSTAIVAALAERVPPAQISTFAIGFEESSFDESEHARAVAEHLGVSHHARRLSADALPALVPDILTILDEPFADASIVPTYLLSRFAREHVKVALGGDGGDELFYGYPTMAVDGLAHGVSRLPGVLRRRVLEPMAGWLRASDGHMSLDFKAQRFLSALDLPRDQRHPVWIGALHPARHGEALRPRWLEAAPDGTVFADLDRIAAAWEASRPGTPPLDRIAWQYFRTYLADGVLTKVDRASMAHGLEVRAPMLDPAVIGAAHALPARMKLRGRRTKAVLRALVAQRVPGAIAARPKKGFGMPVAAWLRGPLAGWMRDVLAPERVAEGGVLNPSWTTGLMDAHQSGRFNHHKPLWAAIVFELWRRGPWGPGTGVDPT